MKSILSEMKDLEVIDKIVTIKSRMKQNNINELEELAENILL